MFCIKLALVFPGVFFTIPSCQEFWTKVKFFHQTYFIKTCFANCSCYCCITLYRGSPDSTNFGLPENRVNRGIVLIGDWFSTQIVKLANSIFKSPFFYINDIFSNKTPFFSVQNSILNALETKHLFLTIKQLKCS